MDLLVKKGVPVQGAPQAQPAEADKPDAAGEQEAMNSPTSSRAAPALLPDLPRPPRARSNSTTPAILRKWASQQNLNTQIPPDLVFRDETGKSVRIGDYFGQKPIVLSLVYFDCPALCTEVLNGELRTMNAISLDLGKDFEAVTVSFEPKDTPALAKAKRDVYARPVRPARRRGSLALPDGRAEID